MAVVFGLPKKVQNRAARFVTSNSCFETECMTAILEKLKWESLIKGVETVDLYSCKSLKVLPA